MIMVPNFLVLAKTKFFTYHQCLTIKEIKVPIMYSHVYLMQLGILQPLK
jgi:hypothetical protein